MGHLLVIIPTYNEKENIERMVHTVMGLPSRFDLLIVEDNSPDGTAALIKALMPQYEGRLHIVERKGKLGLGTAYIHGFKWALAKGYSYIFEMDADFSHNPNDLEVLYDACLHGGADVAIGSRYVSGVNVVNWPMGRVMLSYFASKYVKFITSMPFHDATAGFKCYKRRVLESIDFNSIRFVGYAFQIEMKWRAWRMGFDVREVPIIFTDRREGASKMSKGIIREAALGVLQLRMSQWTKPIKRVV